MKREEPSIQIWKNLYMAARKFKEIECWNWMYDSDLFGVRNPETGETGYCCVMGRNGEHFGLALYLGPEGLEGYLRLQSGDFEFDTFEAFISQKCLMASFEDRKHLDKRDNKIIKKLLYKAEGPNAWPQFRNFLPGYHPWYLDSGEAVFLTHALGQAVDVALRFRDNPGLLDPPDGKSCLVRIPEEIDGELIWREEWVRPVLPGEPEAGPVHLDEVRLARIKRAIGKRYGTWEIDFLLTPGCIAEKGKRPYYPYALLCVDHDSHQVLDNCIAHPESYREEFSQKLAGFIEKNETIPVEILTCREETFRMFEPVASRLDIKLTLTDRLDALFEVIDRMLAYFENAADGEVIEPPGNRKLLEDFEGLTPTEMKGLLYDTFDPEISPLEINEEVDDALVKGVKFFDDIITFLNMLGERQPLKLTQKGNLPLKFCQELIDMDFLETGRLWLKEYHLRSEPDAHYIHIINILTKLAGFTRKRYGKISLTRRCETHLDRKSPAETFKYLMEIYIQKFNWGYEDHYPDSWIIQYGFGFSLLLVQKHGNRERNAKFYSDRFLRAFPPAIEDFTGARYYTTEKYFLQCYHSRVIENFMNRFGLISIREEDEFDPEKIYIKKTELIDSLIRWKKL